MYIAGRSRVRKPFFRISPMEEKVTQISEKHYDFLFLFLSVLDYDITSFITITGNNSFFKRALQRMIGPFFGGHIHCLNSFVKNVLE